MKKTVPDDAVFVPEDANCVFEGEIYDVYQWPQQLFDGGTATFEMLKRADTVIVICIADGKLLVLQDEQPHTGVRRGFPGGRVDPGEAIEAAAKREVLEETGYTFRNWRLIKVWQPHTKIEWFVHLYLAWDGSKTAELHLDGGERIIVEKLSFEETRQLVFNKAGHLGETAEIFESTQELQDLLNLPEFVGQIVDR
jgi:ADP-ribose pyrophosphatase